MTFLARSAPWRRDAGGSPKGESSRKFGSEQLNALHNLSLRWDLFFKESILEESWSSDWWVLLPCSAPLAAPGLVAERRRSVQMPHMPLMVSRSLGRPTSQTRSSTALDYMPEPGIPRLETLRWCTKDASAATWQTTGPQYDEGMALAVRRIRNLYSRGPHPGKRRSASMGRRAKHKSKPAVKVSQDAALASATAVLCPAPAELRRRISDASGASRRPSDVSDASDVEVNHFADGYVTLRTEEDRGDKRFRLDSPDVEYYLEQRLVAWIIGKGGSTLKEIEQAYDVKVSLDQSCKSSGYSKAVTHISSLSSAGLREGVKGVSGPCLLSRGGFARTPQASKNRAENAKNGQGHTTSKDVTALRDGALK
eukprot:symbB.v1.2.038027.t1/scaffold5785.1/size23606/2